MMKEDDQKLILGKFGFWSDESEIRFELSSIVFPLEGEKSKIAQYVEYDIYTSNPTKSTTLNTNMKFVLSYL